MNIGVVLAAGSGSRMKSDLPKQFLPLGGKPVVIHSLEVFSAAACIDALLIAVPKNFVLYTKVLLRKYKLEHVTVLVGGADRNETLMNALETADKLYGLTEKTVIVTHDGARPFVNERMINESVNAMERSDACDVCIPCVDTLVEIDGERVVTKMPERKNLWQCQTPQTFNAVKLRRLYNGLSPEQKQSLTDAGKIFFLSGERIEVVYGDPDNIKITNPSDLPVAEEILKKRTSENS